MIFLFGIILAALSVAARQRVPRHAPPSGVQFGTPIAFGAPVNNPDSLAVGDFNNDGIPDLAVVGTSFPVLSIALGNGNGTFGSWLPNTADTTPGAVAVGNFDADANLDAVTIGQSREDVRVEFGAGNGFSEGYIGLQTGDNVPFALAVADFNGDGFLDIAVTASSAVRTGGIAFLGDGTGKFSQPMQFQVGGEDPLVMVVGDFNGDHIPDLLVANNGNIQGQGANVALLLRIGDGTFQPPRITSKFPIPHYLAVGDFNNDGNLDFAASNGYPDLRIFLGNGDGTFSTPIMALTGTYVESLAAADFNGDGNLDLVVGSSLGIHSGYASVLLGNGDGTFQKPERFVLGHATGYPRQIAIADYNNDGKPDIATINSDNSTVSILLNTTLFPARPGRETPRR